MNDCFLNLLFSFQLLLPLKEGADFVGSKQTIDVILSDLSLLGYVIPVGGLGIGLFICLLAYLAAEYNVRFQSHEKYKIAMNMLHSIHTPLTLLRNQLEDIKTASLSEPISLKIEEVLKYAERIIDCNQNVMTLDKIEGSIKPKTATVDFELSTYITSIVNQCRPYANIRQVKLKVNECSDCVSCRINENIMTAALQYLLYKIILITNSGCCISISVTHTMDAWELHISNNTVTENKAESLFSFISALFPVYGYSGLRTVRKIIRLHGGKMIGYGHGKFATFRIVIPTDCHCQNQKCPVIKSSRIHKDEKQDLKAKDAPHILLVMKDKPFSDYLRKSLSRYYQISILEDPDLIIHTIIRQIPDTIIIDDYAHHPTEIKATIESARQKYPSKKIVAVFMPNTYSRYRDYAEEFVKAFQKADYTFLTMVNSNREKKEDFNIDSDDIIKEINGEILYDDISILNKYKGSVFCFMSCASIYHIENEFINELKEK